MAERLGHLHGSQFTYQLDGGVRLFHPSRKETRRIGICAKTHSLRSRTASKGRTPGMPYAVRTHPLRGSDQKATPLSGVVNL